MSRGVGIWMAVLAVAVGCSHAAPVQDDEVKHITEFRLNREDVVEVSVWKEPELSRTVPIRPDGKITLPLLGDVKAEGLTPRELEATVQKQLASLVRDPHVTVIVHDVNGQRVFVTGMVGYPGAFPLRNRMGVLQALASSLEDALRAARQRSARTVEPLQHLGCVGHDEPRGRRRRRCSRVGGEIAEWRVLLVTDGRDHRHATRGDGAHEALVAERQEVLEAAAASREHDDVHVGHFTDLAQRVDHRGHREGALDVRFGDDDPRRRKARRDRRENVALGRRVVAGHEPDSARHERQRALPLEHAFGSELLLQPLERGEMVADPEALDRQSAHAEVALCLEQLRSAEHVHALAVGQVEPQRVEARPRDRDAETSPVRRILEREEDRCPARVAPELGHLALDPDRR